MVLGEALDALPVALVVLEIVGGAVVVGETPVALAFAVVFLYLPLPLSATTYSQYLLTSN